MSDDWLLDDRDPDLDPKNSPGCCRWMLAATFRSCFGTCFKRFGHPGNGYDSIEGSPTSHNSPKSSYRGQLLSDDSEHGYDSFHTIFTDSLNRSGLDYRSRSTGEIFRGGECDFDQTHSYVRADKRCFSVSFGYLNDRDLFESFSDGMRTTLNSAADLRSDVSDAFFSCNGSMLHGSNQDFYSDDSEEAHEFEMVEVCEGCGMKGKVHNFDDNDKEKWRELVPKQTLTIPTPKSVKWIQLS